MRKFGPGLLACAAACVAACSEPVGPAADASPAFVVNGAGRVPVYNYGVDRAVPQRPCIDDERHRQFDFWVGEWDIGGGNTSRIESILDGCVILEQYLVNLGIRGRSINTYDPDTDLWHQTWVASSPFGSIRMAGERAGNMLHMSGARPSVFGPTFLDEYEWTHVSADEVIQAWTFDYGQFGAGSGSLTYIRTSGLDEGTLVPNPACRTGPGANNTVLDFMHGEWSVERDNGLHLGRAVVVPQSSGCVTTMRFMTDKGYEAIAYTYFDAVEFQFFRTYIDSEGERIELRGFVENGALVLRGEEPGPAGAVSLVRVSIRDDSTDLITERWDVSGDGGQTWTPDLTVRFVRDP